ALRQRVGLNVKIAAVSRGTKIGKGAAGAAAAARRGLEEACAVLLGAIEIRIEGQPRLDGRLHNGFRQRTLMAPVRPRQRSAGAVILILAALLVLRFLEIG